MIYPNEKNRLWNLCQVSIKMINALAKQIKEANMTNENFVAEWIDKLYKVIEDYDSIAEKPEDYLKKKMEQSVNDMSDLIDQLEPYKNDQDIINFLDKLNELSIRY